MGLKDEMEKLIQNEQRRLEYRDNKRRNFHERQHERFQPIRKLVEELATSIEPDYLKVTIGDERAEIAVGTPLGQFHEAEMEWYIEPNFRVRPPRVSPRGYDEPSYGEKPGVLVTEFPGKEIQEREYTFEGPTEAMDYISRHIAKLVARYRRSKQP